MTEAFTSNELAKTQTENDFITLLLTSIDAFSSGSIEQSIGLTAVNAGIVIPMSSVLVHILWIKCIYKPNQA